MLKVMRVSNSTLVEVGKFATFVDAVNSTIKHYAKSLRCRDTYLIIDEVNITIGTIMCVGHIMYLTAMMSTPHVETIKLRVSDEDIRIELAVTMLNKCIEPTANSKILK